MLDVAELPTCKALIVDDFSFCYGRCARERKLAQTTGTGSTPMPVEQYLAEFLDDRPLQQRRPQAAHSFGGGDYDASAGVPRAAQRPRRPPRLGARGSPAPSPRDNRLVKPSPCDTQQCASLTL